MWYYFYSHPVCWYKVLHLSQTSFGWAVEVKAELLRVVAAQLARWLARANINRARSGAMWQLHHHRLPATSWGFLPPALESCSLQRIPEEKQELRGRKSQRALSRGGRIFLLTFSNVSSQFSNIFPHFSNIFPWFSNIFPAHPICSHLFLLERLMRNSVFAQSFCSTMNASDFSSYWIVVYADKSWHFSLIFQHFPPVFQPFPCTSNLLFSSIPAGNVDEKLFVCTEVLLNHECEVFLKLPNTSLCW